MPASPPRVALYVAAVSALGVVAVIGAASVNMSVDYQIVLVLAALCVIGTQAKVRALAKHADMSFNSIVQLAALTLTGPLGAILVGTAPLLFELRPVALTRRLMNAGMTAVMTAAAALAYYAAGGRWSAHPFADASSIWLEIALPLMVANVVQCIVNAAILAGVISLDQEVPYREVVVGIVRSGGVAYVGYGVFGLLLAVLWDGAQIGPLSAVLVLAPLSVARYAFSQYAEENAAHDRTVAALVRAVEAKDFYTRGHSERVAKASVLIARVVGLSQQRTVTLQFAGMLHDVGKLGVPTRVLQKSGALSDEEFASIAQHPVRGLEMVREIEFLGEAFEGILHHHERMDGRGYPMGLLGTAIPEFARIIAVADAFDSMTSTRSYRQARDVPEALAELDRCVGTQFDAAFVTAIHTALERTQWQPTYQGAPEDELEPGQVGTSEIDHDDPRQVLPNQGHRIERHSA